MERLHYIAALVVALLLAGLLGPGIFGWILFLMAGGIAGFLAGQMPPGSERVYWAGLGVTLCLLAISLLGANLGRLWLITPIVFILSYFAARLARKLSGGSRQA